MKYQSLIEYAALCIMAAIVAVVVMGPVGRHINSAFADTAARMERAIR